MKAKQIFCYIPFIIIWCFIMIIILAIYEEGVLSVIRDAFGNAGIFVLSLIGIMSFLSIIYLHFFMKKEWQIQLISYLLTILFCVIGIFSINIGELKFREFSTGLWNIYPGRRITMLEDLKISYDLNVYGEQEIRDLLGDPDSITSDGIYIYNATHGNNVYVEFENGKLRDIYYID